ENGFHHLLPYAADYVQQLIAEFNSERVHGLRCWLLDLIGQSGSPEAFRFLVESLRSDDERLRSLEVAAWIPLGLLQLRRLSCDNLVTIIDGNSPKSAGMDSLSGGCNS